MWRAAPSRSLWSRVPWHAVPSPSSSGTNHSSYQQHFKNIFNSTRQNIENKPLLNKIRNLKGNFKENLKDYKNVKEVNIHVNCFNKYNFGLNYKIGSGRIRMFSSQSQQCYYEILGVSKTASKDEIKKAYVKLAKEYHPDTCSGCKEAAKRKFQEFSEAHSVLANDLKRKQYDAANRAYGGSTSQGFSGFNASSSSSHSTGGSGYHSGFRRSYGGTSSGRTSNGSSFSGNSHYSRYYQGWHQDPFGTYGFRNQGFSKRSRARQSYKGSYRAHNQGSTARPFYVYWRGHNPTVIRRLLVVARVVHMVFVNIYLCMIALFIRRQNLRSFAACQY